MCSQRSQIPPDLYTSAVYLLIGGIVVVGLCVGYSVLVNL